MEYLFEMQQNSCKLVQGVADSCNTSAFGGASCLLKENHCCLLDLDHCIDSVINVSAFAILMATSHLLW